MGDGTRIEEKSADEIIDGLMYDEGSYLNESEEANTDDEESPPEGEVPASEGDQPPVDSDDDDEDREDDEAEPVTDPAPVETPESKKAEEATPPAGEPTVEIDGEQVPLSQVREWKQGHLRQDDYTRKSQEREENHRKWEERITARDTLVKDILQDETAKEMVAAHPEVLEVLLSDPENARKMLGNEQEIRGFWQDYELIMDNPTLVARLAAKSETPELSAELQYERDARNIMSVANALDSVVDTIAAEFSDVDPEEVKSYVISFGKFPEGEASREQTVAGFNRLYNLFFEEDGGKTAINDTLIRREFERLDATRRLSTSDGGEAEAHNRAVDAQLKDTAERPPVTKGNPPAPRTEELPAYKDASAAVDDLLFGDWSTEEVVS